MSIRIWIMRNFHKKILQGIFFRKFFCCAHQLYLQLLYKTYWFKEYAVCQSVSIYKVDEFPKKLEIT